MKPSTICSAIQNHYRLLVVGGGAGGCGAASKFSRSLPKDSVAIIEPHEEHYYQPGFTLVGGGLMTLAANRRQQADLIPSGCQWIKDRVESFNPEQNAVVLRNGDQITYDYLVVAVGVSLRFDMIKGAVEALETPGVCSNYSPLHVQKTYKEAMSFKEGNAIFTFPNTPIKCAGAPQKACYITESILRQRGVRDKANVIYATTLGKIFGIETYARSLTKVAEEKGIDVRTRTNLVEINPDRKIAVFEKLDENGQKTNQNEELEYAMLHIGPPCQPPDALKKSPLADSAGFLDVNPLTLQSKKFENVFGVGDCMNTPNAKTAAAVSSHLKTIEHNLKSVINGHQPTFFYDGYASCPLVVSKNEVILAEFGPKGILETTPLDQSKPHYWAYMMKRYLMPFLYWNGLVKGYWNGPGTMRKFTNLITNKNSD